MKRILSVCLLLLSISACSSLPDSLASNNEALITDYHQWLATPPDSKAEVRLGGVIASVTNLADRTRLEIVDMPISDSGKPNLNAEPSGRYVAYMDGYVESMSYTPGRLITVLGVSDGIEQGKVGEHDYSYRVMRVTGSHLWRIQETVIVHDIESRLSPCYGIHCRGLHNLPSRGRVIQEVK